MGFKYHLLISQNPLKQTTFARLRTNFVGKTFRKSESSAKLKEKSILNSYENNGYSKSSILNNQIYMFLIDFPTHDLFI